jgi:glucoamylase
MSTPNYPDPPGYPGIPPTWTSSAKSGVGTAISGRSRVWFTLSHGIINEVYYPSVDQANTRDLGLLVSDGADFVSEEKRHTNHRVEYLGDGVPGYRLTNTCAAGRYRIEKVVITDPDRDVLLQKITFTPLQGRLTDYKLFVLLAPHIDNRGSENHGWVGDYKGMPALFAERNSIALTLACSTGFSAMSCGYVGFSDGWQDVIAHKGMTWFYSSVRSGNIALIGEIDLGACNGEFVLGLGFGRNGAKAGHQARAALLRDFKATQDLYVKGWLEFQTRCIDLGEDEKDGRHLYRLSTALMKTCEAKSYTGGVVASLSIPWGFSKGDEDLGGYHLVWTRDQVEVAGGFLAAGDVASARSVLLYLMATQEPDGHWPQNMWLDGTRFWTGLQMDETAFPILLVDALYRLDGLEGLDVWSMVKKAATFLVRNGPITQEDRWEEDGGYSPFTLAVEVAGLLAAADFANRVGESAMADYLRQTADIWNNNIERWTYVTNTALSNQFNVDGYYVRIAPVETADASSPTYGFVPIKNRPPSQSTDVCSHVVSPDALALVRFGLRSASDPRIMNTVKVIDAMLKTETATGPVWHRYNGDGYGEHDDGSPFDGTGVGRGWPLLVGERAHYELQLGNTDEAERLLRVMAAQASPGGMLPEQVWDAADLPEKELFNGHPSGSAMPLMWAHAEYIKLIRSLRDGAVFDTPPQPVERYLVGRLESKVALWRFNLKCRNIPAGYLLRIEVLTPSVVHWSSDQWNTAQDISTSETPAGIHSADLSTQRLLPGSAVVFTLFDVEAKRWIGNDYVVKIV